MDSILLNQTGYCMKLRVDTCPKWALLVVALLFSNMALAQRTVVGVVTDAENGEPLIGANVLVVGTTTGAVTDIDGSYSLDVPGDATQLEFSYTGYTTQTITLGASNELNVSLRAGETLDEIIVVGYGTQRKRDLTGSVASLDEKDFNQGVIVAPDQLIQGRTPGVQVVNNSGQPGGATTVRIRGNASIRAGNAPLFVVDGVQLSGASTKPGTNAGGLGATPPSNPLNYLNPNDIESIQVLKDASATAIYGSRGANGVVLITTKRGQSGDPRVSVNTSLGFSGVLRKYDVLDGDEYRDALRQYGLSSGDFGGNVDAFDEITQTGVVNNHTVAVSGGTDKGRYRVSVGYFDQDGIIKNNNLTRLSANINGSYKVLKNDRLQLDFNLIASRTDENAPSISTNAGFRGSLVGNALQWNPTHPLYNADGSPIIIPQFGNFTNPVALLDAFDDRVETTDLIFSIAPSFKISDNLTYKLSYGLNTGIGSRRTQIKGYLNLENIEGRGLASFNETTNKQQIVTNTLQYNNDFGGINFTGLLGYEYQLTEGRGIGFSAQDFIVDDIDFTNIFQNSTQGSRGVGSGQGPDQELQSFFGRVNFNIKDRFLVTGTVRIDGSSKFGENNKYGTFPAFAAAWNLHNEDFLAGGPFDNLKFRVGWGQTGNSAFPAGAAQDQFSFGQQSIALSNVANPDLSWETTTTFNAGFDFALFDYRLTGSLEYFNRNSEDLLFQFPTIQPAPAGFYWINLDGNVINKGVELALNTTLIQNEKFSFDLGGNITFLDNTIENYDGPAVRYGQLFGQGISGATIHLLQNGQALNSFYLRDHIEIGDDGQSVFANNEALSFLGDPNPDVLLGLNAGLYYGNWSLTANFNGSFGADVYNNTKNTVIPIGNLGSRNIDANLLGGENQEATSNAIKSSDRYLESGSYLKLANATLAYNVGNIGDAISGVRLYVTGQNLFVITDYTGFDPEVNTVNDFNGLPSAGIEYVPYPSARTVVFGATFNF